MREAGDVPVGHDPVQQEEPGAAGHDPVQQEDPGAVGHDPPQQPVREGDPGPQAAGHAPAQD